jgi:hypothetical protein
MKILTEQKEREIENEKSVFRNPAYGDIDPRELPGSDETMGSPSGNP